MTDHSVTGQRAADPDDQVAHDLADVARQLQAEDSPVETWQRICELAVKQVDGCQVAAISLVRAGGRIDTPASTDDIALRIDAIQYETQQGPCLDAIREHEVFRTGDLSHETRWPQFAHRAAEDLGVRSMLCQRLFVRGDTYGALNLYSGFTDAFDEHAESIGTLFAAHAALAMSSANERRQVHNLEAALESSRVIGVAVGMVMVERALGRDAAFSVLSEESQDTNVKVRQVAEKLVTAHEEQLR